MTYFSLKPLTDSEKKTLKGSGKIFSDEQMQDIIDLGNALYDIRTRMVSKGWKIDHKNGIWTSPDGVVHTRDKRPKVTKGKKKTIH